MTLDMPAGLLRPGGVTHALGLRAPMFQSIFSSFFKGLLPFGPFAANSKIDHLAHAKDSSARFPVTTEYN